MKNSVELNRPLLKFLLLCYVDTQESSCKDNAKFNLIEQKGPGEFISWDLKEPRTQKFLRQLQWSLLSRVYWVHYKSLVFSYLKVGTHENLQPNSKKIFSLMHLNISSF